jgi:hypothetical protein
MTLSSYGQFALRVSLNGTLQRMVVLHVLDREGRLNGLRGT